MIAAATQFADAARRTSCTSADHGPDREPASRPEPRRDHLHGRRVDAGQEESGGEAENQRRRIAGVENQDGVRRPRQDRGRGEVPAGGDDVRDVEGGGHGGARHEADLHGRGEPSGLTDAQAPQLSKLRRHRARREPHRHPEHLGQGEEPEDPPALVRLIRHDVGLWGRGPAE